MDRRADFRKLHERNFVIPNPWDAGSARLLASLGFEALATTSSGHAGTLGRRDGEVTREEAIEHGAALAASTGLPVSADLENGFGDTPVEVAETVLLASRTGLAGCSIEDCARDGRTVYERAHAIERVQAAVEAARRDDSPLVLTARAENHIRGRDDLGDTIARLQGYQEAGADVLYAPGLAELETIRTLVGAVDRPVNVLLRPGGPTVPELFEAGAIRISLGGALFYAASAALAEAGRELLDPGTHDFYASVAQGFVAMKKALDEG